MIKKSYIVSLLPEEVKKQIKDFLRRKRSLKNIVDEQVEFPKFESSIESLDFYKCIYVHIPKNAGLSLSYTLFGNTGGSHRKIKDYKRFFSKKTFKAYYKFTIVRNPWDRVVSTYFFLKAGGLTNKDKLWSEEHLGKYDDFNVFVKDWLTEENISKSLHFQHQHVFLENEKGEIDIDFIGRFEYLPEDFKKITKALKIKRELKKTNKSNRVKDYKKYYNEESIEVVRELYQKDIFLFNYNY